ncbi:hypothetical protein HanPSC8_Chr06g0237461 [Helianthus annuus]|nr:hypothetical protein HanPSC8_Chr06g0237461 [Helianthus annuus]
MHKDNFTLNLIFRCCTTIRRVCKSNPVFMSILLLRFQSETKPRTNTYKFSFFSIINPCLNFYLTKLLSHPGLVGALSSR